MKLQNTNNSGMKNAAFIYLAAISSVLIWSIAPVIMKFGLSSMELPFLLIIRFTVSSLVFLPLIGNVFRKAHRLSLWKWAIFFGIISVIYYLQMAALKSFPVSWYLIVFALNPLLTLVFNKTKFSKRLFISLGFAIFGSTLFLKVSELKVSIPLEGWIYMIGGMFAWVAYTVLLPKLQQVYDDVEITALTSFVGFIAAIFIFAASGKNHFNFNMPGTVSSISLGILFPLAYYLFSVAIRHKPTFGIVCQYLEPVFGIAIAVIVLGENLQWIQVLGGTMIVGSMGYLTSRLN
ncbi:MAG: DMT family transporter [Pseudobdellovibrionaceae bacterium]